MSFPVPNECTLPTAEQPLRVAEFDDLFATTVRTIDHKSPTHLSLALAGPAGIEATVRDLAARETECCSFFAFTITRASALDGEALTLDIEVPAQHVDVLQALAEHARLVSTGRAL